MFTETNFKVRSHVVQPYLTIMQIALISYGLLAAVVDIVATVFLSRSFTAHGTIVFRK